MESSSKYTDCLKWRENEEWYFVDGESRRFLLTDKAPKEARCSFERWENLIATEDQRRVLEEFWSKNADWYCYDEDLERYFLTDKAPEEARHSFELWKKINGFKWDD